MWLLSCFFTSGWIHSCSREPSTHTLGLAEERAVGSKNQRAPAPSAIRQQEHVLWGARRETELTHKREWLGPERTPGLGGTLSAASPRVSKETRQGKRGRRRRPHLLCAPPPRRLGQDARTPAAVQGSDRG